MYLVKLINEDIETYINTVSIHPHAPRITGTMKFGINTIDSFTFNIFPNNEGYSKIHALKTQIEVYNTKTHKIMFKGRILLPKHSMSDKGLLSKTVVCESELGYLMDSTQVYGEYHNTTVKEFLTIIINNHNRKVDASKRFKVGVVDVTDPNDSLYRYLGYEKTLTTIKDKLIDRLGGELRIRYENGIRYLDYLKEISEYKQTEIRLARNLDSITEEKDPTHIITRLTPLGKKIEKENNDKSPENEERLTIEGINGGVIYIDDDEAQKEFGIIEDSITWDDVNEASNLLRKGKEFLKENNYIKKKYSVSALDLSYINLEIDTFEVGNYYIINNPLMSINEYMRIIDITIDISNPHKSNFTIGDKFEDIKSYQVNANKANKELSELRYKLNETENKLNETGDKIEESLKKIEDIKYNTNKYYMFDVRGKDLTEYKSNLDLIDITVMQGFDIDTINNIGYFSQLKKGSKATILLTKVNLYDNSILGSMELINFGHAVNMCIENVGVDTYIWMECFPLEDSKGNLYGSHICRFKFEDGNILEDSSIESYELLKGHKNTYPAIDKLNNKLAVKSILNGVHYYSVFNLESVINSDDDNEPIMLYQFKIPYGVNELAFQGFEIHGNYIYNYEGEATKHKYHTFFDEDTQQEITELVDTTPSTAYITVLNEKGFIQYRHKVTGFEDMIFREAEGIKIKELDNKNVVMYLGFASGETGERKANIVKYEDIKKELRYG